MAYGQVLGQEWNYSQRTALRTQTNREPIITSMMKQSSPVNPTLPLVGSRSPMHEIAHCHHCQPCLLSFFHFHNCQLQSIGNLPITGDKVEELLPQWIWEKKTAAIQSMEKRQRTSSKGLNTAILAMSIFRGMSQYLWY